MLWLLLRVVSAPPAPPQLWRAVVNGSTVRLHMEPPLLLVLVVAVRWLLLMPASLLSQDGMTMADMGRCQEGCCSCGRLRRGMTIPARAGDRELLHSAKSRRTKQAQRLVTQSGFRVYRERVIASKPRCNNQVDNVTAQQLHTRLMRSCSDHHYDHGSAAATLPAIACIVSSCTAVVTVHVAAAVCRVLVLLGLAVLKVCEGVCLRPHHHPPASATHHHLLLAPAR